ncbi:hypothetical protein BDD12DRAFT_831745, partial [Trichophaea hybrida]
MTTGGAAGILGSSPGYTINISTDTKLECSRRGRLCALEKKTSRAESDPQGQEAVPLDIQFLG